MPRPKTRKGASAQIDRFRALKTGASAKAPREKQLEHLRRLAAHDRNACVDPRTRGQASKEIERLKGRVTTRLWSGVRIGARTDRGRDKALVTEAASIRRLS